MSSQPDQVGVMLGSEAFELEGRVEVVGANLPQDMGEAERARAKAARESNVVLVLERHQMALEAGIAERVAAIMPEGIRAVTQVTFDDLAPAFYVRVTPSGDEQQELDRQAISAALPEIVSDAVSSQIAERATQVGMWRADVKAAMKLRDQCSAETSSTVQSSGRYRAGLGLLGLAAVAAGLWMYLRMSS